MLIDDVDVDFQMEATDASASKNPENADVPPNWFETHTNVQGKVVTSRENTRSNNQTAKYQVSVASSQQQQTEGRSKLIDIMASCIEPLDTKE